MNHDYQILEAESTNQNSQNATENYMNVEISREAIKDSVNHDNGASNQIDSGQVGTQDSDIESEDADKTYDNLKH